MFFVQGLISYFTRKKFTKAEIIELKKEAAARERRNRRTQSIPTRDRMGSLLRTVNPLNYVPTMKTIPGLNTMTNAMPSMPWSSSVQTVLSEDKKTSRARGSKAKEIKPKPKKNEAVSNPKKDKPNQLKRRVPVERTDDLYVPSPHSKASKHDKSPNSNSKN